jgi:hypothetical protein
MKRLIFLIRPKRLTRQDIEMNKTLCVFAFLGDSNTGKANAPCVFDQGERPRSVNTYIGSYRLKMGGLGISS